MKALLTFLIVFEWLVTPVYSQSIHFNNDKKFVVNSMPAEYTNFERTTGFDFQLRMYFDNSNGNKVSQRKLLMITLKKGKWDAIEYTYTKANVPQSRVKIDSSLVKVADYNKLIQQLDNSHLFSLKNIPEAQWVQITSGEIATPWPDGGYKTYKVELLSHHAKRGFEIGCPQYYFDKTHLPELKSYIAVIQQLLELVNIKGPC